MVIYYYSLDLLTIKCTCIYYSPFLNGYFLKNVFYFILFTFIKSVTFSHFWRGKMCQVVTENLETTLIRKSSIHGWSGCLVCTSVFMQINDSCWGSQQPLQQQQQRKLSLAHVKRDCTALEQLCCSHEQSQGLLCCCVSPQVCEDRLVHVTFFLLNPFFLKQNLHTTRIAWLKDVRHVS